MKPLHIFGDCNQYGLHVTDQYGIIVLKLNKQGDFEKSDTTAEVYEEINRNGGVNATVEMLFAIKRGIANASEEAKEAKIAKKRAATIKRKQEDKKKLEEKLAADNAKELKANKKEAKAETKRNKDAKKRAVEAEKKNIRDEKVAKAIRAQAEKESE